MAVFAIFAASSRRKEKGRLNHLISKIILIVIFYFYIYISCVVGVVISMLD
jgi:hypothetical protein